MSRRQKKWILYSSPFVLLLALGLLAARQIRSVEQEALRLAQTGRSAIALFSELAAGLGEKDLERIARCYDDGYRNAAEVVWREEPRSARDGVQVLDWQLADARPAGKEDVVRQFADLLAGVDHLELSKIKLDRIERIEDQASATARATLWLRGARAGGESFETQVTLRFGLAQGAEGWKIRRQELLRGVTTIGDRGGFREVAEAAGIDFVARLNPRFEDDNWRLERFGIAKYATAGVSAVDYDGDGWDDLYFGNGAGPRLYRNEGAAGGGLRFTDVTADAGLPPGVTGSQVGLFADFDGDGDKDLFMGRISDGSRLYRNEGDGTFTDVSRADDFGKPFVTVAAAADYDLDGDLDLYVGRYLDPRVNLPETLVYTRNGEGNSLFRNDGGLRFTDVTEEAGVREGGLTLGVTWGDYDEDGDPDLYVANDFGRNALLRNEGDGTFADVTLDAGVLDIGYGMSASWGDVDNDGDLDLYVSNVHSAQRWYAQSATLYQYFVNSARQGTARQDLPLYREIWSLTGTDWRNSFIRSIKGNSLYLNEAGRFVDVAERSGTNPYGWYWGSTFLDFDNDGRLDIYAANGWISGRSHDDL